MKKIFLSIVIAMSSIAMEINMDKENIYLLTQDNNKGLILYKIRQKDFY